LIPAAKRGGGKRRVDMRAVVNGVMHVLSTGCRWRYLPREFPSRSTVKRYFCPWNWDGTRDRLHHAGYFGLRAAFDNCVDIRAMTDAEAARRIKPIESMSSLN
jgi:putative transposase